MLYCPDCQALCAEERRCPSCGRKKLRPPEENDPVFLLTADETKAGVIKAAFQTAGIPFEERTAGLGGPPDILVGASVYTNKRIFVPYGEVEDARAVIDGTGIMEQKSGMDGAPEDPPPGDADDQEELSPRKRLLVRIFSFLLFILAIWGVVSVSDFLANALKDFLYHL